MEQRCLPFFFDLSFIFTAMNARRYKQAKRKKWGNNIYYSHRSKHGEHGRAAHDQCGDQNKDESQTT